MLGSVPKGDWLSTFVGFAVVAIAAGQAAPIPAGIDSTVVL